MTTTPVSREYLLEILNYDQETGIFTWKKKVANCIQIGDVAGCGANSAFHYIGTFDLLDDAIAARNNAAKTLHKDFYRASV